MKKQLLFVFALLTCTALSAQTYLSENFNGSGTALPTGWSQTMASGSDGWLRDVAANLASNAWGYPDNGSKIMSTNDDGCDCDKSADRLILPALDLTTATAPFLVYDQYYFAQTYQTATEEAYIEVSTDGGTSWETVDEVAANTLGGWQTVSYSLADYAGEGSVLVSFLYNDDGGWLYGFGVDNVIVQEQPQGLNLAVNSFDAAPLIDAIPTLYVASTVVTGRDIYFAIGLTNTSGVEIDSFDATVSNGSSSVTQTFTNQNLAWLGNTTVVLDDALAAVAGSNDYTVTISNVNGAADDDNGDNSMESGSIDGVSLHPAKAVLMEEATGTWCGWCVRGTIMMEYMSQTYPDNFIGVAIHNEDPMALDEYDGWIQSDMGVAGWPSVLADRDGTIYDPLDMENITVEKASQAPAVEVDINHTLSGNTLTMNVSATYNENLSGDYRFNVILVEDHLSGSGATWSQTNYYDGGPYGPMGGFESAGSPVAGLFYDHVGRALVGGTDGAAGSLPASGTAGSTYTHTFTATLANGWNPAYIHPIVIVVDADSKEVLNAKMDPMAVTVNEVVTLDNSMIVYPNPSNGLINLQTNLPHVRMANIRVYNSTGDLVMSKQVQNLSTTNVLDVQEFGSGLYTIVVDADGYAPATRRVTVVK